MCQSKMTQTILSSHSEDLTLQIGRKIGYVVKPGDRILLSGDLGAGKTRLAKGIISAATQVPVNDITSPTFSIAVKYDGPPVIYHVDLYRIVGDFEDLGLDDQLEPDAIIIAEWAESLVNFYNDALTINIFYGGSETDRELKLQYRSDGNWAGRLNRPSHFFSLR